MAIKKYMRKTGKKAYSTAKKYAKKRYVSKAGYKYDQIMKDIMVLKSIVNAEKKQFSVNSGTAPLGQTNGLTGDGAYIFDITPTPAQGTGDSNRVGDSIKLHSAVMNLQLKQQANTSHATRCIMEIYQVLGTPQTVANVLGQMFKPTPFLVGAPIRDYNAAYDQDYRQQYRCLFRRKLTVKADQTSVQTTHSTYKFPLRFGKFGQHIKYAENSGTVASGQIVLIIRCDSGNMGSAATTISNAVSTGPNSGLVLNRAMEYYYYDN